MKTRIALVGVGGYGTFYLQELLRGGIEERAELNGALDEVQLVAGIDPYPEQSAMFDELKQASIPVFPDLASFYQQDSADLVIIAAPIHLHAPLTELALSKGSNVLCEKPLGASSMDAQRMLDAQRKSGKVAVIGYQWSFSDAVLALKKDILSGRLGQPRQFKTLLLWPRSQSYYQRNEWAGRIRTKDGDWVLDSPVNNATAHYLHNMLFLLGDSLETSASPAMLQAELYRANSIENYDTAALRVVTETGTPLLFLTTHAVVEERGPVIQYELEDAVVGYSNDDPQFRVSFRNGLVESYGNPADTEYNKLWQTVGAVQTGHSVVCGLRTAIPHLLCVLGAQETPIADIPEAYKKVKKTADDRTIWVKGLAETFLSCYQNSQLPSETGEAPWAIQATKVAQFPHFP